VRIVGVSGSGTAQTTSLSGPFRSSRSAQKKVPAAWVVVASGALRRLTLLRSLAETAAG
jgi:hypothetical protein